MSKSEGNGEPGIELTTLQSGDENGLEKSNRKPMPVPNGKSEHASNGKAAPAPEPSDETKSSIINGSYVKSAQLDKIAYVEDEDIYRCGFGCISWDWMQVLASKKMFMLIYSILALVQSMGWAYFASTLTTLEKRFKISAKTAGIVMTGNEMSQIIFAVILSHYGAKGHRPRWLAFGTLLGSLSCFVLASPHLFYGAGEDSLALTVEHQYNAWDGPSARSIAVDAGNKSAEVTLKRVFMRKVQLCDPDRPETGGVCHDAKSILPLIIIFASQFIAGIGNILFFSLGGPYLDDSSKRENMPIVFGLTSAFRLIGPTLGFLLGAGCLKLYINPWLTPIVDSNDAKWIGAWWLGWLLIGILLLFIAFGFSLFPREIRRKSQEKVKAVGDGSSGLVKISEIPALIAVLMKNKVNLFNQLAGLFYIFAVVGYGTFAPKYLETIFMQSAANASIFSGSVAIGFQSAGLIASGFFISKFKPSARKLAAWNVFAAFLTVTKMIVFTQIGCDIGQLHFGGPVSNATETTSWNDNSTCNQNCNCELNPSPVCYKEESMVYFSACHAGCRSFVNGTISDCSCLPSPEAIVKPGNCAEGCFAIFLIFMGVVALVKLIDSTGRVGNILIAYRCVDAKDRSLSIGLHIFLISLFALLPSPIVFGTIIDSVCLVWNTSKCKETGNCALYDGKQLRYVFNLTAAAFVFVGAIFDCLVWYYVKDLELYSDPEDPNVKPEDPEAIVRTVYLRRDSAT